MSDRDPVNQIASQLRDEGYWVAVRPGAEEIPSFLTGFSPDLIARNDHESVVVMVREREALSVDTSLFALAKLLENQQEWRLDVLFPGQPSSWPDPVTDAPEPSIGEMDGMVRSARRLAVSGDLDAACLLGWAAIEASLRALAQQNALRLERNVPIVVLKTLYSQGILSRQEYEALHAAMRVRNTVSHGLRPVELTTVWVASLLDSAGRLLASLSKSAA
jgi:hypothetical protein